MKMKNILSPVFCFLSTLFLGRWSQCRRLKGDNLCFSKTRFCKHLFKCLWLNKVLNAIAEVLVSLLVRREPFT